MAFLLISTNKIDIQRLINCYERTLRLLTEGELLYLLADEGTQSVRQASQPISLLKVVSIPISISLEFQTPIFITI